jgi:hypothetical protein
VTWIPPKGTPPFTIPFGQWADFVFKFRHSLDSTQGFLQVWMNGTRIVNHQGPLGFNTPGFNDYTKFGQYNTSANPGMQNPSRKLLLRHPVVVADPTGNTYTDTDLRNFINQ